MPGPSQPTPNAPGADDGKAKRTPAGVDNTACPLPFPKTRLRRGRWLSDLAPVPSPVLRLGHLSPPLLVYSCQAPKVSVSGRKRLGDFAFSKARLAAISARHSTLAAVDPFRADRSSLVVSRDVALPAPAQPMQRRTLQQTEDDRLGEPFILRPRSAHALASSWVWGAGLGTTNPR